LIFGEMSKEVLSTNTYVIPKKLVSTGYKFFNSELEDSLRFLLGKTISKKFSNKDLLLYNRMDNIY